MARSGNSTVIYATLTEKQSPDGQEYELKRTVRFFKLGDTIESEADLGRANRGVRVAEQGDMRASKISALGGKPRTTKTGVEVEAEEV